jgi:hypothetical protein
LVAKDSDVKPKRTCDELSMLSLALAIKLWQSVCRFLYFGFWMDLDRFR